MEILQGPFGSTAEILGLINNVAIRESLRRYRPHHHAVFVDKEGQVVLIVRSKEKVSIDELSTIRDNESPGAFFFVVTSGLYNSEAELKERIDACVQAYSMAPPATGMEERIVDGKRVLIMGADPRKIPKDSSH